MSAVLVIGSFNIDHVWTTAVLPHPGQTLAGTYTSGAGGKGFNQAVAAARAGAATSFVCALGNDAGGHSARSLAAADQLDLRDQLADAATGTAGIYVDGQGRNTIVIGAGANAGLTVAHVEAQAGAIAAARVVLAQLESPLAAVARGLAMARDAGVATLLNPAPAVASVPAALLAATDVLTPNESEFADLLERHVGVRIAGEAIATLEPARLHGLCRQLLPAGSVVVTLGASGCFVSHAPARRRGDAKACYAMAAEPAKAIDTTGAGDAFNGALAASLACRPGDAFARHVRSATRYAALSTETAGASSAMPRLADVVARFPDEASSG